MQRPCDACKKPYEAKRSTSRFCSAACRNRAKRSGNVRELPVPPSEDGPIVDAARAELDALGATATLAGQRALHLAKLLQSHTADSGSSKAALDRQLAAAMVDARGGATRVDDPLDEVARKRDLKRAAAGGRRR